MDKDFVEHRFRQLLTDVDIGRLSVDFTGNDMVELTIISEDFKDLTHSDRVLLIAQKVVAFTYEILGNPGLKIVALTVDEEKLRNQENNCEKMEDTGCETIH